MIDRPCLSLLVEDKLTLSHQETDSSAHLDKRSKGHHISSHSRFDLPRPEALLLVLKAALPPALFALQKHLDTPLACLRRRVSTRALIGQAHLSVREWREVNWIEAGRRVMAHLYTGEKRNNRPSVLVSKHRSMIDHRKAGC